MTFEEKLSQMYNEIANEISGMIPVEWEQVFTIAYVTDQAGEVIFNYTKPGSDELNYYSDIPKDCNVSKDIFKNSWFKVYRMFDELRETFKEEGLEPWTSCEFDFTRDGKLNVSFDYLDWINTEFDQLGRENYYMYKKFGVLPETEYEMEEIKEIEQYIKEPRKLKYRGDNMTFEEKLSQMYNEIANEISGMIPVEWEKVYTMAYIDDGGGEVFFNYTKPGSEDLNYYTDIPKEYNVSVQVFDDLWMDLYDLFEELRNIFKEEGHEPWTSCEFDFTKEGELKVSFDYIDWINTEFDQLGRENYYMYKKFGVIPEMEYEMEEIKEIKQYIKEQDEAEL
ncbi:TIGR01741 family protein [Staphylococcus aureus]|nr:TIGR01741 family protein [Staphylococcus aureus]